MCPAAFDCLVSGSGGLTTNPKIGITSGKSLNCSTSQTTPASPELADSLATVLERYQLPPSGGFSSPLGSISLVTAMKTPPETPKKRLNDTRGPHIPQKMSRRLTASLETTNSGDLLRFLVKNRLSNDDESSRDSGFESNGSSARSSSDTGSNSDFHRLSVEKEKSRFCCRWRNCESPNLNDVTDLWDHLRECHVECLRPRGSVGGRRKAKSGAENKFSCRWVGCKAFEKPPTRGDALQRFFWLENHVQEKHGGPKPHKCIFGGCSERFGTKMALNSHLVNSHETNSEKNVGISQENGASSKQKQSLPVTSGEKSGCIQGGSKMGKSQSADNLLLNVIRQQNRRRMRVRKLWTAFRMRNSGNRYDFLDQKTIEVLRWRLAQLELKLPGGDSSEKSVAHFSSKKEQVSGGSRRKRKPKRTTSSCCARASNSGRPVNGARCCSRSIWTEAEDDSISTYSGEYSFEQACSAQNTSTFLHSPTAGTVGADDDGKEEKKIQGRLTGLSAKEVVPSFGKRRRSARNVRRYE